MSQLSQRSLLAVVLALVACTSTNAPSESVRTPTLSPALELAVRPPSCPGRADIERLTRRYQVQGAAKHLVPRTPSSIVWCGPGDRQVLLDKHVVGRIVDEFNALTLIDPGVVFWGCPIERRPKPTYGLFFNYPDREVLLVTVTTSGCLFASNGHRMAFTNPRILGQVASAFQHL